MPSSPRSRPRIRPLRSALTSITGRLRAEDGVAVVVSVFAIAITLALVGVVVSQATVTSGAASEDRDRKRALQAANAGLEVAVAHLNEVVPDHESAACILSAGATWCPPVSADLADGERYTYWTSGVGLGARWVVSQGTAGSVTRRVAAQVRNGLLGEYAVRSDATLSLVGNADISGSARSNANISLRNNAEICGYATPGPAAILELTQNARLCDDYNSLPAAEEFPLPPVAPPAPEDTDNERICVEDLDCLSPDGRKTEVLWDGGTRDLTLLNNSQLHLGGNVYSFCQLTLSSNSELVVSADDGLPTEIYIGGEGCDGAGIQMDSNTEMVSASGDPASLRVYVAEGAPVTLDSNSGAALALYAPGSPVRLKSNSEIVGSITAGDVSLDSNASVVYHGSVDNIPGALEARAFRECAPPPEPPDPADPASGC